MSERIPVREAAEILGMSQQGVREHMKKGLFASPIGYVISASEKKKEYYIYKDMLNRYIGKEEK